MKKRIRLSWLLAFSLCICLCTPLLALAGNTPSNLPVDLIGATEDAFGYDNEGAGTWRWNNKLQTLTLDRFNYTDTNTTKTPPIFTLPDGAKVLFTGAGDYQITSQHNTIFAAAGALIFESEDENSKYTISSPGNAIDAQGAVTFNFAKLDIKAGKMGVTAAGDVTIIGNEYFGMSIEMLSDDSSSAIQSPGGNITVSGPLELKGKADYGLRAPLGTITMKGYLLEDELIDAVKLHSALEAETQTFETKGTIISTIELPSGIIKSSNLTLQKDKADTSATPYGPYLSDKLTLEGSSTLTVPANVDLGVYEALTIAKNSTLIVEKDGTFSAVASVINQGILLNNGMVAGGAQIKNSGIVVQQKDNTISNLPNEGTIITSSTATAYKDKKIEVPASTTIAKGDTTLTIEEKAATVDADGVITLANGGKVSQGTDTAKVTITAPAAGATVNYAKDGKLAVSAGATITKGDSTVTVPAGGAVVDAEGTLNYTVTFDSQSGSAIEAVTVAAGSLLEKPANPSRSGYNFKGWYKDDKCTLVWDFDKDKVDGNITLYANWTKKSSGGSSSSSSNSSSSKPNASVQGQGGSVSAATNGTVTITPDKGYQIDSITVNGKTVSIPSNGKLTGLDSKDKVVVTFEKIPAEEDKKEQPTTTSKVDQFTDVKTGAWYYNAIKFVVDKGLFNGITETTFSPRANMSRAMLFTVLARLDGQTTEGGALWYSAGMDWAVTKGISDGSNPKGLITREELAVMLYRYAGSPAATGELSFTDAGKASAWATDALRWAVAQNILSGKGQNMLDPTGTATRAEVATMLQKYAEAK